MFLGTWAVSSSSSSESTPAHPHRKTFIAPRQPRQVGRNRLHIDGPACCDNGVTLRQNARMGANSGMFLDRAEEGKQAVPPAANGSASVRRGRCRASWGLGLGPSAEPGWA
jgi:hypothetical protein